MLALKLKHDPREAAFLARLELLTNLLPAVFNPWGITDVRGVELLGQHAPKTLRAWSLLEGPVDRQTLKRLTRHLASLRATLDT